ncbi:MAG: hypothetical protein HY434_02490 [Candidatus Liptonbacteria bacterium]|nr:hypothetical protein [Candidatus Liptonbacteria bacterium]
MKTLFLVDANSIIHRSFHALPPLTSPDGKPVQAIYGLASILLKLRREEKPDYAAALFDRPEPTFRKEKFEEYKAQRPPAPSELISQIIEAHRLFEAFGIKTFEKPGFEADDLIATLAEKFKRDDDIRVVILTGDMDTLQLVDGERVVVRAFKKGITDTVTYDDNAVRERYGLNPSQIIDYKALVGDPSDNIKGVPGIGPKTAAEILKKFGSVEEAYEKLKEYPRIELKLGPFQKEALRSKDLVTLKRDVPVAIRDLEELEAKDNFPEIKNYFEKLGFKTLAARAEAAQEGTEGSARVAQKPRKRDQRIL